MVVNASNGGQGTNSIRLLCNAVSVTIAVRLESTMKDIHSENRRTARAIWKNLNARSMVTLKRYSRLGVSVAASELLFLYGNWYITHSGLLHLAARKRCAAIEVEIVPQLSNPSARQYAFKATVHTFRKRKWFVGFGDADPSNVSPLVHGAELRVAETRAVNRALRKAYGIGICSVEEIGAFDRSVAPERPVRKLPPESCNGSDGYGSNRNGNSTRVRDRLCQLIRQHKLDAELVKAYAVDFCGTKTLREASRKQVESFVTHLADWAGNDRNALLCQLNSYQRPEEPATLPQAGAA
jgi:hypothetical protein